jgi:hypothetical protein
MLLIEMSDFPGTPLVGEPLLAQVHWFQIKKKSGFRN